jgi:HSP20 family protein
METTNSTHETSKPKALDVIAKTGSPDTAEKRNGQTRLRTITRESLSRTFDHFAAGKMGSLKTFAQTLAMHARLRVPRFPRVELARSEDQLEVDVEVPGVEPADIEVAVQGSVMTIRGTRLRQREKRNKDYYQLVRSREAFERSIPLAMPFDVEKVTATITNGLLRVRMARGTGRGPSNRVQVQLRSGA